MKKALVLLTVVCWAGTAWGDVVPNLQYDGWRGWNNHDASYTWMDSWGNHDDWGSSTYCDAAVAQFDRPSILTAINNVTGGSGPYDAYLHIAVTQDADNLAALGIARPVAGVFAIDNFPWGSATGTGTNFEVNVVANANGSNMHDDTFAWSYDTLSDRYLLNLNVGQAMVDFYLNHTAADGFFISNANPDGTYNPGQRLDTLWGQGSATFTLEIVPEPATLLLLGLGGLGVLVRRKRQDVT